MSTGTKGKESRLRIVQAAIQEFADKGYHATKVSDIVRTAGLTQAAFYLYFPSKEMIFDEICQGFIEKLKTFVESMGYVAPLPPNEIPEQIRENLLKVFEFLGSDPDLTRVAWYESGESQNIKKILSQAMSIKIAGNQTAGKIRQSLSPDMVADCIIGMITHLTEKWLLTGEKTPEVLTREMAQLTLNGLLD